MSWSRAEAAAYRVLRKAAPITSVDPSAYLDDEDEHDLTKVLRKARRATSEALWTWDALRLAASETAADEAQMAEATPQRVAWAYVRSLLSSG